MPQGGEGNRKPKLWVPQESLYHYSAPKSPEYHYPIPNILEGDPFDKRLEPLLATDQAQCNLWKDEVQNLLIFAGLFSAVVTAFLIESYKTLQPDKSDLSAAYLAYISTRLDSLTNTTLPPPSIPYPNSTSFSPTSSSTRVNIFWFLSLILSLTTVLVGIISLQWLREHQRYPQTLSKQEAFAIFHMRSESLCKWYVPQIFTGLPLLLQLALIFFFAGIIDFLQAINKTVALPVIVFASLTLCFFAATTIIPVFQSFIIGLPLNKKDPYVLTPCAYKSPQAWAFLGLLTWSKSLFLFIHFFILRLFLSPISVLFLIFKLGDNAQDFTASAPSRAIYKLFECSTDWIRYEIGWLAAHTCQSLGKKYPELYIDRRTDPAGDYDATRGVVEVLRNYTFDESLMCAAYHHFQKTSHYILKFNWRFLELLKEKLRKEKIGFPLMPLSECISADDIDSSNNEKAFAFLQLLPPQFTGDCLNIFNHHYLEISTRLFQYIFARQRFARPLVNPVPPGAWELARRFAIFKLDLPSRFESFEGNYNIYGSFSDRDFHPTVIQIRLTILEQRLLTLAPFFKHAGSLCHALERNTTNTNPYMCPLTDLYMDDIAHIVHYLLDKSTPVEHRQLRTYLSDCNNFLDDLLNEKENKHLYYSIQLYIKSFYRPFKRLFDHGDPAVLPDASLIHSVAKLDRTVDSYRIMMVPAVFRSIHEYHFDDEKVNRAAWENERWNDFLVVIRRAEYIVDNPDGPLATEPPLVYFADQLGRGSGTGEKAATVIGQGGNRVSS